MCGIFAFTGNIGKKSLLKGIKALELLEYRGYDSCGLAFWVKTGFKVVKKTGYVEKLKEEILKKYKNLDSNVALFHTRWATHGGVTVRNAHPHLDCQKTFFVVHNGIIDNFQELKNNLQEKGHKFKSQTDTEVIAHLLEENFKSTKNVEKSFLKALTSLKGSFGIVVANSYIPDLLMVARNFSPIHIGIGTKFKVVSSDTNSIVSFTNKIIYLEDGEAAFLRPDKIEFKNIYSTKKINKKIIVFNVNKEFTCKGEYKHFMLKEIFEQPQVIEKSYSNKIDYKNKKIFLDAFEKNKERIKNLKRVKIIACGSSFNAGLVGKYFFENVCKIPCEAEWASEFSAREPVIDKETMYIFISQSGETADTISALRKVKEKGGFCVGIVNNVGSTISRIVDCGFFNHVGPEIGVASTKTTISQIIILSLIAMWLSQEKNIISPKEIEKFIKQIKNTPKYIQSVLAKTKEIENIVEIYKNYNKFLFIGRGYNFGSAVEGALKLKEISYIPSEGYGAGEMKHGPIAMIDKDFPVFAICFQDSNYDKMLSNIAEVKARGGKIIALANYGDEKIKKFADNVIFFDRIDGEFFYSVIAIVCFQLFAYYMGVKKGLNVDRPRNLAKSVTVQ